MSVTNNKKGFTLIEIVIVLAIAALVLAAVLLAVSGAQKSRRDSQRKNDAGRIVANIETNASNHAGVYMTALSAYPDVYNKMNDPLSGNPYADDSGLGSPGSVKYTLGDGTSASGCNGEVLSTRQFKVEMKLESTDVSCQDTH